MKGTGRCGWGGRGRWISWMRSWRRRARECRFRRCAELSEEVWRGCVKIDARLCCIERDWRARLSFEQCACGGEKHDVGNASASGIADDAGDWVDHQSHTGGDAGDERGDEAEEAAGSDPG